MIHVIVLVLFASQRVCQTYSYEDSTQGRNQDKRDEQKDVSVHTVCLLQTHAPYTLARFRRQTQSCVRRPTIWFAKNHLSECVFVLSELTVVFVEGSSERGAVATTYRPPVTLDQMYERLYCKDYIRLGFMATSSSQRLRGEAWRVSLVNSSYNVCKRYSASPNPI